MIECIREKFKVATYIGNENNLSLDDLIMWVENL